MRVLIGNSLEDGFLDYAPRPGFVTVTVRRMLTLMPVSALYFERPRDWRMVMNYVLEIGIRSTLKKILSRSAERYRNEKFLSVGLGTVTGEEGGARVVAFVATRHPRCVDRIVVPEALTTTISDEQADIPDGQLEYADLSGTHGVVPAWLEAAAGWDAESGLPVPDIDWLAVQRLCRAPVEQGSDAVRIFPVPSPVSRPESSSIPPPAAGISGTLVGYGNYAKTVILPSLPAGISIRRIHEVDPLQVPRDRQQDIRWSTSPILEADDDSSVVFIAGYHHSHAPMAVEALERGKDCVVEKPLATSRDQLAALARSIQASRRHYFACFQKRYSQLNDWARDDLGAGLGEPINYHAVVYEVPLPDRHWYRWPNSRSRLVSNGCHWLDHFLFLNDWSTPETWDVQVGPDGTLGIFVVLGNRASMTLALTDVGSERIGVQDHIELRAGRVTVTLSNDSGYKAENSSRILRRSRINKMATYRQMYAQIGQHIVAGSTGDTWQSVLASSSLILDLEDLLASRAVRGRAVPGMTTGAGR